MTEETKTKKEQKAIYAAKRAEAAARQINAKRLNKKAMCAGAI